VASVGIMLIHSKHPPEESYDYGRKRDYPENTSPCFNAFHTPCCDCEDDEGRLRAYRESLTICIHSKLLYLNHVITISL